jgi:aminoglycoside phosphotransferase (APT) family kinase protein
VVEKGLNSRLRFEQLPDELVAFAERTLGSRVVAVESQAGGFSPGTADRLLGDDGARLFMKAVSRELNAGSFRLFHAESAVLEALNDVRLPAPRFRGRHDFGDWVALAFDDVDGREPEPDDADAAAVFAALAALPDLSSGLTLPDGTQRTVRGVAARWAESWDDALAAGALEVLPPFAAAHSATIDELVRASAHASDGTRLQHVDAHADNMIVDRTGTAWLVDWSWAAVGAPWFDSLGLLASWLPDAGVETVQRWSTAQTGPLAAAVRDDVDAVLAGLFSSRLRASLQPSLPGLVGLREAQRQFAFHTLNWLAHRRSWA